MCSSDLEVAVGSWRVESRPHAQCESGRVGEPDDPGLGSRAKTDEVRTQFDIGGHNFERFGDPSHGVTDTGSRSVQRTGVERDADHRGEARPRTLR